MQRLCLASLMTVSLVLVAGCGDSTIIYGDAGIDGAAPVSDVAPVPNQPPTVKINRNADGTQRIFTEGQDVNRKGEVAQGVEIQFILYDKESDFCSLLIEYSADNGLNWQPGSSTIFGKAKNERTSYISSAPAGVDGGMGGVGHRINWDVYRDLGPLGGKAVNQTGQVRVRLTPGDVHIGTPDTSDPFFVPPQPGDVHRFGVLASPTFATQAKIGYTGYLAMIPTAAELTMLQGPDGAPGSYDDLLLDTLPNPPVGGTAPDVYTVYAGIDDYEVPGVAVSPNGVPALFLRVPAEQLNGGAASPEFLFDEAGRILPTQPGYAPIWTIPSMRELIGSGMGVDGSRLALASHFFENGRRYIADLKDAAQGPMKDGDGMADYVTLVDGTQVNRCVDTGSLDVVVAPCLDTPKPPRIPAPASYTPKPAGDCTATLPTFKQMVDRGFNAIVVDIVADSERLIRLSGVDGMPAQGGDDLLIKNGALRDVAGSNPNPQFTQGIIYWYPGAGDLCAQGVGRAPDGHPALFVTVPDEDKNNLGSVLMMGASVVGGGYLESNVGRPLPGEIGYAPLFNVPATWIELRDVAKAAFPSCALADNYWEDATVYLTSDQLTQGTKGPDTDGDGCADSIVVGGTTYHR